MVDVTLSAYIADITSVVELITTFIHDILQLVMTTPVLEVFAAVAIFGVAVKIGFRIMRKAKGLAN